MKSSKETNLGVISKFGELVEKISDSFFYVVFGGIAVDGYAGKITRNHSDVDMIIFREDLEKAEKVLEKLGHQHKRFTHPNEADFEYKMQTGNEDHLFSFQIADNMGENKFEISFYRDPHMTFPLSYIKPPTWIELEKVKFPAVSKEMLIKLKENEIEFYGELKTKNSEKYERKRNQQHLNAVYDLKMLKEIR